MIERRDHAGKPIGPKGFAAQAVVLVALTALEARDRLISQVFSASPDELPDDDVTVMVLRRLPATELAGRPAVCSNGEEKESMCRS